MHITAHHGIGRMLTSILLLLAPGVGAADGVDRERKNLAESSLEELMSIEVSSVSRKEQKLSQAAAAIYVITQDDIRRSGATSVPDALRLAPGVDVARIDASKWAITARGFNGRFANKMLVLIDGRSVYTNLYSGVYWDQNDVMIEDIERIEVIRGPGATMWGANAVNGVINIITKTARQTQGTLVSLGTGSDNLASAAVRYGGKIGERIQYRFYSKYELGNDSLTSTGKNAGDRWESTRGGARVDWQPNSRDSLTFHGDAYGGKSGQMYSKDFSLMAGSAPVRDRIDFGGGYGLARWTRRFSHSSDLALQAYYTDENRIEGPGTAHFRTVDFDFQHRLAFGGRHDFTWGLGYRRMGDSIVGRVATFDPPKRTDDLYSSFLQDDISLIEDQLTLSVGSKFQHNAYSGWEYQPSVRLLWALNHRQSLWVAASRAVRTPSRRDTDLRLDLQIPQDGYSVTGELAGSKDFRAEVENAYEAGFRTQVSRRLAFDFAGFYNRYRGLQEWTQSDPLMDFSSGQLRIIVPMSFANSGNANTYGMETAATWTLRQNWKITGAHSWLQYESIRTRNDSFDYGFSRDNAPRHQFHTLSSIDLTPRITFDTTAYYVGELEFLGIPSYLRLDTRLAFKLSKEFELSIGGRNLLDDRHPEFRPEDQVRNTEVRRSAWVRLMWFF